MVCCCTSMQAQIDDPSRVYDIVTDTNTFYLFSKPKPCFDGVYYWAFTPINRMVQEYVAHDTVTVYGVAITFENNLGPMPVNDTSFHVWLFKSNGPSYATSTTQYYEFRPIDTVTLNRSNPRFCWFLYEDTCEKENTYQAPCYEFYFDTPEQINRVTDTFYVGRSKDYVQYAPGELGLNLREYGARYDNSLPGHIYEDVSAGQDVNNRFVLQDWYDNKRWGWAFPIIGFRCGPIQWYNLDFYEGRIAQVRWRSVEEGTLYNVRLVGDDGSDTTYITSDTTYTFMQLLEGVRYNVMLRKQCHYATSNYDTTVYGEWLSYIYFGGNDDSVGIAQPEMEEFSLVPNPTSGAVLLTADAEMTGVEVYTAAGVPFLRLPATGRSMHLDTTAWPTGTYLLVIATGQGTVTRRLSVAR